MPEATMVTSALFVVAVRHGQKLYAFGAIVLLLIISTLLVAQFYAESTDLFILFRLMIMVVLAAATLVVMGGCIVFGSAIGGAVIIGEFLLSKRGILVPIWLTLLVSMLAAATIGLIVDF